MDFIFWRFIDPASSLTDGLHHHFNFYLITLSILNAAMAAYVAFTIIDRLKTVKESVSRRNFLLVGATAMGFGIWSMHFTAMQACHIGTPVSYDLIITIISIFPAIIGSFFALRTMSCLENPNWKVLQLNALFMALGIGTMHYTGMEAIRAKAYMGYDLGMFLFSILSAHILATISLYVKKLKKWVFGKSSRIRNISCSLMMGAAVSCMHYTAMYAVHFIPSDTIASSPLSIELPPTIFASLLFGTVLILLSSVTVSVFVDQAMSSHRMLIQTIISTTPVGLMAITKNGKVRSINKAATLMFGVTEGHVFDSNSPIIAGNTIKQIEEEMTKKEENLTYHDVVLQKPNGANFPTEITIARATLDDDQILVIMVHDLSTIKEAEGALMQNSKMASLGKMASGLAHEINTPLGTVIMRSSQILRFLDREEFTKEKQKEFTRSIHQAGQHIESIITGLQTFSRSGESDPFISTEIEKIIKETLSLCGASLENHGVDVQVENFDEHLAIECRPSQICQILLNLIENAKQAVTELQGHKSIAISAKDCDDHVQIKVTDNGGGIPEEIRSQVLEPFFTTKDVDKGTGLGLSISKGIADAHSGHLFLDTEEKNTTFVIELPKIQNNKTEQNV